MRYHRRANGGGGAASATSAARARLLSSGNASTAARARCGGGGSGAPAENAARSAPPARPALYEEPQSHRPAKTISPCVLSTCRSGLSLQRAPPGMTRFGITSHAPARLVEERRSRFRPCNRRRVFPRSVERLPDRALIWWIEEDRASPRNSSANTGLVADRGGDRRRRARRRKSIPPTPLQHFLPREPPEHVSLR